MLLMVLMLWNLLSHVHLLVHNYQMNLYYISGFLLTFTFILPVFRQYKGYYFYYFFLLSCSGLLSILLLWGLKINANIIILLVSHFLIYSLHPNFFSKKLNYSLLIVYITMSFLVYFFLEYPSLFIYFILLHLTIVYFISYRMLRFVHKYLEVKYFHLALLLYEISVIGKYLSLIMNLSTGIHYFTITNIFQIFLAIFFCIYREDTPYKAIKLTWNDDLIRDHLESPYFKKWDI